MHHLLLAVLLRRQLLLLLLLLSVELELERTICAKGAAPGDVAVENSTTADCPGSKNTLSMP